MIRASICVALTLAAGSAAAVQEYEYKCWVTLANDQQVISFQKLNTQGNHSAAERELKKLMQVQTPTGNQTVKQVHECTLLHQSFVRLQARELDQKTVR